MSEQYIRITHPHLFRRQKSITTEEAPNQLYPARKRDGVMISENMLTDNLDLSNFLIMRNTNITFYKTVLKVAPIRYCIESLVNQILKMLLTVPPNQRNSDEIKLLLYLTQHWSFIEFVYKKGLDKTKNAHEFTCQKLTIREYVMGELIFKEGLCTILIQGDPPDAFYYIIEGRINLYKKKDYQAIQQEILIEKERYQKLSQRDKQFTLTKKIINVKKRRALNKLLWPMKARKSSFKGLQIEKQIKKRVSQTFLQVSQDVKAQLVAQKERLAQFNEMLMNMTGGLPFETLANLDIFVRDGVFLHKFMLTLKKDQQLGELGILMDRPRACTAVASSSVKLGHLKAHDYGYIFKERGMFFHECINGLPIRYLFRLWLPFTNDLELKKLNDKVKFFEKNFFHDIPQNLIFKHLYNFQKQKYTQNQVFYNQGDRPSHVYLVKSGIVEVSLLLNKQLFKRQDGKNTKLCQVSNGSVFGESEIITKTLQRTHSALCKSSTVKVYVLSSQIFEKILDENPAFRRTLTRQTSERYQWQKSLLEYANHIIQDPKHVQEMSIQLPNSIAIEDDTHEQEIIKTSTSNLVNQIKLGIQYKHQATKNRRQDIPEQLREINKVFKEIEKDATSIKQINKRRFKIPENIQQSISMSSIKTSQLREEMLRIQTQLQGAQTERMLDTKELTKFLLHSKRKSQISLKEIPSMSSTVHNLWSHRKLPSCDKRQPTQTSIQELFKSIRSINIVNEKSIVNQQDAPLTRSPSKEQSGMIPSKHNMFRLKPKNELNLQNNFKWDY